MAGRGSSDEAYTPVSQVQLLDALQPCGDGGIGRHASLRSWWPKGREGSSPFLRTLTFARQEARS